MTEGKDRKDDQAPQAEVVPVYEEDVVAGLHAHVGNPKFAEQPKFAHVEALSRFTRDLTHLEFFPLYERYRKGEVPTLQDLQKTAEYVRNKIARIIKEENLAAEESREEVQISKLLEGRAENVRKAVNRYVQTVIRFHTAKRVMRLRPERERDLMQESDRARRIAHDSLIESLRVFSDAVRHAIAENIIKGKEIAVWDPAHPLRRSRKDDDRVFVFSPSFLNDRDFIRNWAMTIDYSEKMESIEKAVKEEM